MQNKFIILVFFLITACGSHNKDDSGLFTLKKGDFSIEIVESGEINATHAVNISSPQIDWRFGVLKINQIIDDGTLVKKGDTVVLFDPSEIYKVRLDANANLEIARAELNKLLAEQNSKIRELESNLKISELSYEIARIRLEQASYEADVTKKEISLNLEKTKIDLNKVRSEIENQKKINTQEVIQKRLDIKQLQSQLDEADRTLRLLTVVSPTDGIAVIGRNWSTRAKWQVGDQPWSGTPLILLPDLSELKVETEINEVDIAKIKVGQEAKIRLDAFSDKVFTGKVTTVANLATFKDEEKSKIKVFPIEVVLDTVSEELLPGMTVSCRIMIDKIPKVLSIPLEALQKKGTRSFVYLKSGKNYKEQDVKTGRSNNDYIIIEEGLQEGDEIALSVPQNFLEKEDQNEESTTQ